MKKETHGIDFERYAEILAQALLRDSRMEPDFMPDLLYDPDYCQLDAKRRETVNETIMEAAKAILKINGYPVDKIFA